MGIVINNASFILRNSNFLGSPPIQPIGQIFRAYSYNFDALIYPNISGSETVLNIPGDTTYYVLALSKSLSDNPGAGVFGQIVLTSLFLTSTVDQTPTFTEQLITTTGAGNWTKPTGVTQVIVECWGGGGAGGGATGNPAGGAGGGGGQYSRKLITYPSAQQIVPYSVGTGGTGTTGVGGNGGDTTWNTNQVIAKGGTAGGANGTIAPAFGGLGNIAGSIGDVIYFGAAGNDGGVVTPDNFPFSGEGGGGAGSATSVESGQFGGRQLGGDGGSAIVNASGNGNAGLIYGGGGGGGSANTTTDVLGGNGAQGLIRLIYR